MKSIPPFLAKEINDYEMEVHIFASSDGKHFDAA